MSCPNIGDLRHRLTIERQELASDTAGGRQGSWAVIGYTWGAIHAASGRERLQDNQYSGEVSHRIEIRWTRDLKSDDRFVVGSRIFDIKAILEDFQSCAWMTVLCQENYL